MPSATKNPQPHHLPPTLHVFDSPAALGIAAARDIAACAADAVAARGKFTVAISGGSLPKLVFPALLQLGIKTWGAWYVFWADERMVPHTHPDSNFAPARKILFDHVSIPPEQIFPVDTAMPAGAAAQRYQSIIETTVGTPPQFDAILLGMGPDGHTASLFPRHALLAEKKAVVAPIFDSPKPPPERVTLTLPVLNRARRVFFIVTGAGKAAILPQIFAPADEPLPAAQVHPKNTSVRWYLDSAAAQNLKH